MFGDCCHAVINDGSGGIDSIAAHLVRHHAETDAHQIQKGVDQISQMTVTNGVETDWCLVTVFVGACTHHADDVFEKVRSIGIRRWWWRRIGIWIVHGAGNRIERRHRLSFVCTVLPLKGIGETHLGLEEIHGLADPDPNWSQLLRRLNHYVLFFGLAQGCATRRWRRINSRVILLVRTQIQTESIVFLVVGGNVLLPRIIHLVQQAGEKFYQAGEGSGQLHLCCLQATHRVT